MKKYGMYIFVFVVMLLATSFIFFFLNEKKIETSSPSDYVRIDNLQVCGVASPTENLRTVSICGSVVADKPSVPIRMYIYAMPSRNLVAENQVGDRFSPGEFVRDFDLVENNNSDSYKFVAYFYKNVVGEMEFRIKTP